MGETPYLTPFEEVPRCIVGPLLVLLGVECDGYEPHLMILPLRNGPLFATRGISVFRPFVANSGISSSS